MKLKYKFSIILLVSVILIGFGLTYTLSTNFMQNKKESIYEAHTVSALHISEKLGQYIYFLKNELKSGGGNIKTLFPDVLATFGEIKYNPINLFIPDFKPNTTEELKIIGDFFIYNTGKTTVVFQKKFLNQFTALAPSSSLALMPMHQNEIISIAGKINSPSSEFLEQVLSQQNKQAVVANFSKKNGQSFLTVLAPISNLKNVLLVLQTNQQDITQVLIKAISEIAPFLIGMIIFTLALAALITGRVTKALEELTQATKMMAKGEWKTVVNAKSNDEVGQLIGAFNQLGSDLEQREVELIKVNNKLNQAEKLASLGMFSAGIAHEVKNPLGAILGNAQLIKRKLKTEDEDALRYSNVIINESYRATNIIEDLLVFAKERPLNRENHSLDNINEEIQNALTPKLNEKEIGLTITSTVKDFNFDKEQMIQVLQNMINNAIDAYEGVERDKKMIQLTYQAENENLIISIKDNASGIPKDHLSKIFEPFFSSKKIKKGTGLGMAICYGIIHKHGGEIKVESTVGMGTLFRIQIPIT